ncbi:MBL fold metallo-hydrolase [Aneurinibacillus sp. REN35]|uniref:MBL fold metallo-hydrolase n=1 Tax=Aneurinibacillus sp. REN35 TaxID=3237286 RepID=UPI003528F182
MNPAILTATEVAERVIQNKDLFILDVRNEEDFQNWKIEGAGVTHLNVPYFDLLEGVDAIMDKLPEDKEIVVVCAKEGSSKFVADQLAEAGRTVAYLQGGMKSWSEHLEPVKLGEITGGAIYQFNRLGKGCLSYLIASEGEAVVVDAVRMTDTFIEFAKQHNLRIKYVLDTHLHADHISGGRMLAEKTGATYWLPPKDAEEVTYSFEPLEDGKSLSVGQANISVQSLYSPGHTIGSTSLIVDNQYLLTGDILFVDSIGRPDLAGKAEDWVSDLRRTLYQTYKQLSPELYVLPAHFAKPEELDEKGRVMARLGDLYAKNAGLQVEEEDSFRRMVTENLPPQPNAYQEIRETNMGKREPSQEEQREMEIGPNRCAVS